ncbi:MAG: diaminopimelate decarboxylase [Myxococcota bacterium]|jgi:diaminopimelate decarboxylase
MTMTWNRRLKSDDISPWLRQALAEGLLNDASPSVVFHDLVGMRSRVKELHRVFPDGTLHAIAIKANPVVEVLRAVVEAGGGLEAASMEEVELALAAGCLPERVVFDSPAKTRADIDRALELGVYLNADNLDELDRIGQSAPNLLEGARVGLRINPCVGEGSIAATSTGGKRSRFGLAMPHDQAGIEAFAKQLSSFEWLRGLHVHVGSQGCDLATLVPAGQRALTLAHAIDAAAGERRIDTIDIGGGLPTRYRSEDVVITPAEYVAAIEQADPALLDYQLITEFGRSVQAPCGFAATRVEYIKELDGEPMAVVHLGADFALRVAYHPDNWWLDMSVYSANGEPKELVDLKPMHVAGPLCFSGDFIARARMLPAIEPGDILVLHDTGAYTMGMWSRHCSRGMPTVVGIEGDGTFRTLRKRESTSDMVRFWS